MADFFCYHCARYHPEAEMTEVETKNGKRKRCIKSINAAKRSQAERDAFGKRMTEQNSRQAKEKAKHGFIAA